MAVSLVAKTALKLQDKCVETLFCTPVPNFDEAGPLHAPHRIAVLAWQWDETSQRVSSILRRRYAKERISVAPIASPLIAALRR